MSFTYDLSDLSSNRSRLRLLVRDTDPDYTIFQDEELDVFLSLEESNLKRAAAMAYEVIAGNEAYIQKVQKTLDIQTDGARLADAFMKQAEMWRKQAAEEEANDEGGAFDWAEMVLDTPTYVERLQKVELRG